MASEWGGVTASVCMTYKLSIYIGQVVAPRRPWRSYYGSVRDLEPYGRTFEGMQRTDYETTTDLSFFDL